MKPLSKATAEIFQPIKFSPTDRINLVADETRTKFSAGFWNNRRGNLPDGREIKDYPTSAITTLVARFPEKKKIATFDPLAYEIPATDYICELINALVPANQLTFHDEETETVFNLTLARSRVADVCAEWNAAFRDSKQLPDICGDYLFPAEFDYAGYQRLATAMVDVSPGFALFMEQGTGKTPVGVAAVCNAAARHIEKTIAESARPRMLRCLIVAPNNVRANWESEFLKFATMPGKVTVLRGPEIGRVKQLIDSMQQDEGDTYTTIICGYETLTRSWEALGMVDWDIAILDEGHYIKSPKTKRFQTAMKLRDKSDKRIVLTGTPIANSVLDLFAPLEFLGKGYSGFSSFEGFRKFYGVYENSESGYESLVGVQNLPFMRERLARYSFIIRKKEALPDLPEKVYDISEVELTSNQADYYKEVATNLAIEIENDLADDSRPRNMVINNVLTKLLRLTQITSGFMSWQPVVDDEGQTLVDGRIEYFYPNPKVEALLDLLLEKGPTEKTSVWSCFNASIDFIVAALEQNGIDYVQFRGSTSDEDRERAVWRFNNDDNCRVFVCNGAAGGTGLNLLGYPPGNPGASECNHNHCIVYDQNWSALIRGQLEDRGHRRGTRGQFRVTDLVVPRTIDEEIRARVVGKQLHALEVSDVRAILSNVFKTIEDYQ